MKLNEYIICKTSFDDNERINVSAVKCHSLFICDIVGQFFHWLLDKMKIIFCYLKNLDFYNLIFYEKMIILHEVNKYFHKLDIKCIILFMYDKPNVNINDCLCRTCQFLGQLRAKFSVSLTYLHSWNRINTFLSW